MSRPCVCGHPEAVHEERGRPGDWWYECHGDGGCPCEGFELDTDEEVPAEPTPQASEEQGAITCCPWCGWTPIEGMQEYLRLWGEKARCLRPGCEEVIRWEWDSETGRYVVLDTDGAAPTPQASEEQEQAVPHSNTCVSWYSGPEGSYACNCGAAPGPAKGGRR